MAEAPQLLHHMANVQGEDGVGEQRLQVGLQALGPIEDDLHRLGRVRPEATLGRFRSRPPGPSFAAGKRSPDLFVNRSVELAISAPPERVHDQHGHLFAILVFIPSFMTFFGAANPALTLAAVPLTATTTARAGSAVTPPLG